MKKFNIKNKEDTAAILADAYLNCRVSDKFYNPLMNIPKGTDESMYYLYLMSQPNYFYFLCKEILGVTLSPFQCVILKQMWEHKFPMLIASRGASKSFLLAIYSWLRLLLLPGRKVLLTSASFRQSKIIFEYIERIWYASSILRDIGQSSLGNGPKHSPDRYYLNVNDSSLNAVPTGQGDTIRGLRSHDTICDEFGSVNKSIFEQIIIGFSVVTSNPIEAVRQSAKEKLAKKLGISLEANNEFYYVPNQTIIAGTADYDFTHFAEYWKRWRAIIQSKGNPDKLKLLFNDGIIPNNFDWQDYCIMRIPVELIPEGFMDASMIARAKATVHSGVYYGEYAAIFTKDSHGFFKRSIIEKCVCSNDKTITVNNEEIFFKPMITGDIGKKYVMAIDPASEVDNFAIVVLEANPTHRKVVHVWTTNREQYQERKKANLTVQDDFYDFCCAKIRELMNRFQIVGIAIDSQGGGIAISSRLGAKDILQPGEVPLLPVIDYDNPKPTDSEDGLHIIELIQFSNAQWVSDANHGLRHDLEQQLILFPFFDVIDIANCQSEDYEGHRIYDTIEDAYLEIEELKTELTTIVMTRTQFGRDKWSTPSVKDANNKKGRLRKDRYSGLIMANYLAKKLVKPDSTQLPSYVSIGGFADNTANVGGNMYTGGGWLAKALNRSYGGV